MEGLEGNLQMPACSGEAAMVLREQYSQEPMVRIFSPEEAASIVSEAEVLQEFKQRQLGEDRLSALLSEPETRLGLPISRIYELAKGLNVGRQAIDEVLATRYPSIEQQIADIKKFNSKLPYERLKESYLPCIVSALKKVFPTDNVFSEKDLGSYGSYVIYREIEKAIIRRGWFGRSKKMVKKEQIQLARIAFGSRSTGEFVVSFYCDDPVFLRAAGKTLETLQEKYKEFFNGLLCHDIKHNYDPFK